MADIASAVGVHKSTVTRALRNDPRIRPETVEKVVAAAKKLGYERNPAAAAFSEMRWHHQERIRYINLGFLGVAASEQTLTKSLRFQRVHQSARNLGYNLLPLPLHQGITPGNLNRKLKAMNIQGVVLDAIGYDPSTFPSFDWDAVHWQTSAWVSFGEGEYSHPGYRVLHNSFMATMDALREMVARGYFHIYFARSNHLLSWELWREQAATLLVCNEHPALTVFDEQNPPKSFHNIDAILGSDPETARKLSQSIQGGKPWASLQIDDHKKNKEAGMYLDPREGARSSVEFLDRLYRDGSYGLPQQRQTLMLESRWQDGESLPLKRT